MNELTIFIESMMGISIISFMIYKFIAKENPKSFIVILLCLWVILSFNAWVLKHQSFLFYALEIGLPFLIVFIWSFLKLDLRWKRFRFTRIRFNQTIKKKFYTDFLNRILIYITLTLSFFFLIYLFIIFDQSIIHYSYFFLISILIISGIFYLFKTRLYQERVIIIIGKEKQFYHLFNVPPKTLILHEKDFFDEEHFLIDQVGIIRYQKGNTYYKDRIYWLATTSNTQVSSLTYHPVHSLFYHEVLSHFDKYHYDLITLKVTKDSYKIILHKRIK